MHLTKEGEAILPTRMTMGVVITTREVDILQCNQDDIHQDLITVEDHLIDALPHLLGILDPLEDPCHLAIEMCLVHHQGRDQEVQKTAVQLPIIQAITTTIMVLVTCQAKQIRNKRQKILLNNERYEYKFNNSGEHKFITHSY